MKISSNLSRPTVSARSIGRFAGAPALAGWLARQAGADAGPAIVVPGFGQADRHSLLLRWALQRAGVQAGPWRLGRNLGPTLTRLQDLQIEIQERCRAEGQPITLIGCGLGYSLARQLAQMEPMRVREVVYLDSPGLPAGYWLTMPASPPRAQPPSTGSTAPLT